MSTAIAIHPQSPTTEQCPWCESTISRKKFVEVQTRIADLERRKLGEERERMKGEFRAEMENTEARVKDEAAKKVAAIAAERDRAAAKVKELEAQSDAIAKKAEKQAEIRVKADFEKKMAGLVAERDEGTVRVKELEEANKKNLVQQRTALEKDRDESLLKQQSQANREREQLQKKLDALTRQVQRKTSDELGDGAEVDVYEALRETFPRDEIARIKKGQPGADIRHRVLDKGVLCGTILFDSKNRQGWQNTYVTKLREDQMADKAEYAILATTVFPSGKKELYIDDDTMVIVVNRARVVEIVGLLRRAMQRMQMLGLSQTERAEKRELLYKYITSEDYRQHLIEGGRLTGDLAELDVEEKRTHDKVWEKRGKMTTRLRNIVREMETEVCAILEGRRS